MNRTLIAISLVLAARAVGLAQESGLVAWWALEEGRGTETKDRVAGLMGQVHGATWITDIPPVTDGREAALRFDGNSADVLIGESVYGDIADDFTIAFWACPTAARKTSAETSDFSSSGSSGERFAIAPFDGANVSGSIMMVSGAGVSVGTNGIGVVECYDYDYPVRLNVDMPLSGWRHIAVVYRAKTPSLYLDGVFLRTGKTSSAFKVGPGACIGGDASGNTGGAHYQGDLDDVRIYNRALGDSEVDALAHPRHLAPTLLRQLKLDGSADIAPGGSSDHVAVLLAALAKGTPGNPVALEFEVAPIGAPAAATVVRGETVYTETAFRIRIDGLLPGTAYGWRVRTTGDYPESPWAEFGTGDAADFVTAANLVPSAGEAEQRAASTLAPVAVGQGRVLDPIGIAIGSTITDPEGDGVRLELEVRTLAEDFRGEPTARGAWVASGDRAMAIAEVHEGSFHWRYRAVDSYGGTSDWTNFGANSESDADFSSHLYGSSGSSGCSQSAAGRGMSLAVLLPLLFLLRRSRAAALAVVMIAPAVAAAQAPMDRWDEASVQGLPFTCGANGSLVGTGEDASYCVTGSAGRFWKGTPSTGAWIAGAAIPKATDGATTVAAMPGTTQVYVQLFNNNGGRVDFLRYDAASNAWSVMAACPPDLGATGALVATPTAVFALTTTGFLSRFTPPEQGGGAAGRWDLLNGIVPANRWSQDRPALCCPAPYDTIHVIWGHDTQEVWFYAPDAGAWRRRGDFPVKAKDPSLCAGPGGLLYAQPGGLRRDLYSYDPVAQAWTVMPGLLPATGTTVYGGLAGGLLYPGIGDTLSAVDGNRTWRYSIAQKRFPSTLAPLPAQPGDGGSMTAGTGAVFLLHGDGMRGFSCYSMAADAWFPLADAPVDVYSSAMVHLGGDFVYASITTGDEFGQPVAVFARYSIPDNSWKTSLADPGIVAAPTAKGDFVRLAWDGADSIYAFFVDQFWTWQMVSKALYRYSILTNTWAKLATPAPSMYWGSADLAIPRGSGLLYLLQGDGGSWVGEESRGFWSYDIAADAWTRLEDTPVDVGQGRAAAMVSADGGRRLFALLEGSTLAAFDREAGHWSRLAEAPMTVGTTMGLATPGSGPCLYAAPFRACTEFWRYRFADGPTAGAALPLPVPTGAGQFKADGHAIAAGATGDSTGFIAKAGTGASPSGFAVRLEVEVRPSSEGFRGTPTSAGPWIAGGVAGEVPVRVSRAALAYHWQIRAKGVVDAASPWVEFGPAGGAGPDIDVALPETAPLTQLLDGRREGALLIVTGRGFDAEGDGVVLQVEVKPLAVGFSDKASDWFTGALVDSATPAEVTAPAPAGDCHFRARFIDAFGTAGTWTVRLPGGNPEEPEPTATPTPTPEDSGVHGHGASGCSSSPLPATGLALAVFLGIAGFSRRPSPVR